jgi:hypothetical protein
MQKPEVGLTAGLGLVLLQVLRPGSTSFGSLLQVLHVKTIPSAAAMGKRRLDKK